jgi:putative nucleotidyltransferase with HDIG domain
MSTRVNRKEALESIQANIQDKSRVEHMMATEAIMRALAQRLGEDINEWGITGLLHDIDIELIEDDPSSHGRLGADIARELGANDNMVHAILCHNTAHGIHRETKLDKSLFCTIHLSKLLARAISIQPDGIAKLSTKSIMEDHIAQCSDIGLGLEEFITIGIEALKDMSSD